MERSRGDVSPHTPHRFRGTGDAQNCMVLLRTCHEDPEVFRRLHGGRRWLFKSEVCIKLNTRPPKLPKPKRELCQCGSLTRLLGSKHICWKCWHPLLVQASATMTMRAIANTFELTYSTVNFILHPWTARAQEAVGYAPIPGPSSKRAPVVDDAGSTPAGGTTTTSP